MCRIENPKMRTSNLPTAIFLVLLSALYSCTKKSIYESRSFTFPEGKLKAVVFSYDDGVEQDKQLAALFNKYNLKGTFNLNSGKLGTSFDYFEELYGRKACYLTAEEINKVFANHEVASHTVNHPHLHGQADTFILNETRKDILALQKIVKYPVVSFAYPFGDANETIAQLLNNTSLTNARTINNTNAFRLPENFLLWHPTCHHTDAYKYVERFNQPCTIPSIFYIWGHSWEFEGGTEYNNWTYFESICKQIANREDTWYPTIGKLAEYLLAVKSVIREDQKVTNPSNITIYLLKNGEVITLNPGETKSL